jgi:hypothetical protein
MRSGRPIFHDVAKPSLIWPLAAAWVFALAPAGEVSAGLLRWWQMTETSGSTMVDSIGQQSGTYINSPTLTGEYVTFNGTTQWGEITTGGNGNSTIFNSAYERARSLGMWVKLDNTGRFQSLFGTTVPSGGAGWSFDYNADGTLRMVRPGSVVHTSTAAADLEPGVWAHVGYTLNGTLKFYVNGQQVGSDIAASNAYNNNGGTTEPTVGLGSAGGTGGFMGGSMADVRYIVSGYGPALDGSNGMAGFTDGAITAANMQTLFGIKPFDAASVTAGGGGTIASGGTFTVANAAASGGRTRDSAVITALPTLSGTNASRFTYTTGLTLNEVVAPGGSASGGTVTFTDASNLLNGSVVTATLGGLAITRESMPGFTLDGTTLLASGTVSYTVTSPTITGNTAPLGVAQTAAATNLAGLSSETIRGVANALGTRATLLAGTADNGTAVSQTWRLRTGTGFETAGLVASDVVDLVTPTTSNAFVLQLSYDPADVPAFATEADLLLGWADPGQGGEFVNAVLGNSDSGAFSQFVSGAWNSSYATPGYFGLDTQANTAWAVIDHNSDFAVIVVPEPQTRGWAGVALAIGLYRLRRR